MRRRGRKTLLLALALILPLAAGVGAAAVLLRPDAAAASHIDPSAVDLSPLQRIEPEVWACLREKRILFGHQSVGDNIIAGMNAIMDRMPEIGLRIVESRDPAAFDAPGLVHTKIGENEDTDAKLADFAALVQGPLGDRTDIAIMKFCYVDLKNRGVPETLFKDYRQTLEALAVVRPGVRFIHVTMPLTTVQAGPKAKIKKMIGEPVHGYPDNILRNRFNRLLVDEFSADHAVFDLAAAEARLPDGRRAQFTADGESWDCLSSGYARDRGHPNEAGELAAARDLLLVLAEQCR